MGRVWRSLGGFCRLGMGCWDEKLDTERNEMK